MAMANQNNATRARGFLDEAMSRLDEGADEREQLYIKALDQLIPKKPNEKDKDKDKDERGRKKAACGAIPQCDGEDTRSVS